MDTRPVGVFDSGAGGISVLRELVKLMPGERFLYFGDTGNAPYGVRPVDEIRLLTLAAADSMVRQGIKALVIACNTATAAAADALKEKLPIPVIGIEPALRDAAQAHRAGAILVMATPATLRQEKFMREFSEYGRDAVPVPCGGLMEFVERLELDSPALFAYLKEKLATTGPVESIVLGCTHYPFVKPTIARIVPGAAFYDAAPGVAQRTMRALVKRGELCAQGEGGVQFTTTGGEQAKWVMESLFAMAID